MQKTNIFASTSGNVSRLNVKGRDVREAKQMTGAVLITSVKLYPFLPRNSVLAGIINENKNGVLSVLIQVVTTRAGTQVERDA